MSHVSLAALSSGAASVPGPVTVPINITKKLVFNAVDFFSGQQSDSCAYIHTIVPAAVAFASIFVPFREVLCSSSLPDLEVQQQNSSPRPEN